MRWVLLASLLAACDAAERAPAVSPALAVRILPAAAGTFGYEVTRNGQPLIRQLTVPGRTGTRGFPDPVQAGRVGRLVARKLSRGEMPPTVSSRELDSMAIGQ